MKYRRTLLQYPDFGYLSRVLNVFPSDYKIISMRRGIEHLPNYVDILIEHDSFPDQPDIQNLPIWGWIREEDGKIKIRWGDDQEFEEKT